MKTPLIICGAFGRMGRAIIDLAHTNDAFLIEGGTKRPGSSLEKPHHWSFPIYENLDLALKEASKKSIIIDFSDAQLAIDHVTMAKKHGLGILIGSTGHSEDNILRFREFAESIPIVFAPNTSLMANLVIGFSRLLSRVLPTSDVGIIDIHHTKKKDAPSGTAKAIKSAIIDGFKYKHENDYKNVDIYSLRLGDTAGVHTVYFASNFESLEITHRVTDRRVFAEGALLAAQFLFERRPGLYYMNDVLNINLSIENRH